MEDRFIVLIGASAGGLDALQSFFSHLEPNENAIYVVVQHLSPDQPSLMEQILPKVTSIPVETLETKTRLKSNHIYLNVPRKSVEFDGFDVHLVEPDTGKDRIFLPIDQVFENGAHRYTDHCISIVLSGSGTDGARGVKEVHERGGLVLAQDPTEAQFGSMPAAAIHTGVVDNVQDARTLAETVSDYVKHRGALTQEGGIRGVLAASQAELEDLFARLLEATEVDFRHYKSATISRRLEHRMGITGSNDLKAYLDTVNRTPEELIALSRDMLIGVTQFFRDGRVFEKLSHVLTPLFDKKKDGKPLRVWCVGCSTGEEALSLAMMLFEIQESCESEREFKVFATDVDTMALETAGNAVYSHAIQNELTPERLQFFFDKEEHGKYAAKEFLRRSVIYAKQNLIQDPPFSKMDVVVCRNMLIYLNPEAQRKAFGVLNFALNEGGYLVLGAAETPTPIEESLNTVFYPQRIFKKREGIVKTAPLRVTTKPQSSYVSPLAKQNKDKTHAIRTTLMEMASGYLIEKYLPASFVITQQDQVISSYGDISRFVVPYRPGQTSDHIKDVFKPDIARVVLDYLTKLRSPQSIVDQYVEQAGTMYQLASKAIQVRSADTTIHVISFEPELEHAEPTRVETSQNRESVQHQQKQALEREVEELNREIIAVGQELTNSREELQIANEELMASNEELQGTNEELQSVNEELYTVNAEYQQKIEELAKSNSDLNNLLRASGLAMIFLDGDLKIRWFTPEVTRYIALLPQDHGRKLSEFSLPEGLRVHWQSIKDVVVSGESAKFELVQARGDTLVSATPYVNSSDRIDGAVISFIDISALRAIEQERDLIHSQLELAFKGNRIGAWSYDGEAISLSEHLAHLLEFDREDALTIAPETYWSMVHPDDSRLYASSFNKAWTAQEPFDIEYRLLTRHGNTLWIQEDCALGASDGKPLMTAILADISKVKIQEQKLLETQVELRQLTQEQSDRILRDQMIYENLVEMTEEGFWIRPDIEKMDAWFSNSLKNMIGLPAGHNKEEPFGVIWREAIHPDDKVMFVEAYERHLENCEPYDLVYRVYHRSGDIITVRSSVRSFIDPVTGIRSIMGVVTHIK